MKSFTCKGSPVALPAQDWREQVSFLREVGATSAQWDQDGRLTAIALGPDPTPRTKTETQPKLDEEGKRAEHRRIALASSSRLVPARGER